MARVGQGCVEGSAGCMCQTPLCTNVSQSEVVNRSVLGLEPRTVVMRQNDKCTLSNNLTSLQQKI